MRKIAIIGGGEIADIYAVKARKIGVKTICFSLPEGAVAKDDVDKFYPINIFEKDELVKICREEKINGVIPTTELTISIATYIAQQLGLNGNNLEVMTNITSKNWVRDHLQNTKLIRQPKYLFIPNKYKIPSFENIEFPVIVKPTSEGGKRGINVVYKLSDLSDAVNNAFEVDQRNHGIIIEQFLTHGMECSVEGLSYYGDHQIIQITQNLSSGAPHCVELGHSQPADISIEMRKKVINAIKELLNRVGFKNGATHTEIKIVDGNIYLMELNSRIGGDSIAYPLTELSTNYDYIGEIIKVSMDEKPKDRGDYTHVRYSGMRYVVKQTEYLSPIFKHCENEKWCYRKHFVSNELVEMTHNDQGNMNYFIYASDTLPVFKGEEKHNNC